MRQPPCHFISPLSTKVHVDQRNIKIIKADRCQCIRQTGEWTDDYSTQLGNHIFKQKGNQRFVFDNQNPKRVQDVICFHA